MSTRITRRIFLTTVLFVATWASAVSAQSYYVGGYIPYVASGDRGFYGGYHSSTAVEGYLRGQAELVRGRGVASLYHAQALRQREAARKQYLENRVAKLRYYAERQKVRAERTKRTRQRLAKRLETRKRLAAKRKAKHSIAWPEPIMAERYESIRTEVESLAKLRSELGTKAGRATTLAVRHGIRELAKHIVEDEQANRLTHEQSKVVWRFVRDLASNILGAKPSQLNNETIAMSVSTKR